MTFATSSSARAIHRASLGLAGVAGALAAWQLAVAVGLVDPFFVGSPVGALREGAALATDSKLWTDAAITLVTLAKGLALALVVGVPLGVVLGRCAPAWTAVELPILMLNATPTVALVPPIIMIVGIGPASKVVLGFVGALIPVVVSGRAGAATVPDAYVRAARVYGAGRVAVFVKVVLPYALLSVLSGVRLGVGRAVTAVLVGELYATQQGLGLWVTQGQVGMNANLLVFVTMFVATVGALAIGGVNVLDRALASRRGTAA